MYRPILKPGPTLQPGINFRSIAVTNQSDKQDITDKRFRKHTRILRPLAAPHYHTPRAVHTRRFDMCLRKWQSISISAKIHLYLLHQFEFIHIILSCNCLTIRAHLFGDLSNKLHHPRGFRRRPRTQPYRRI